MTRSVRVGFVTDGVAAMQTGVKRIGDTFDAAAGQVRSSARRIDTSLDTTAGHADNVASKGAQAAGALGGLGSLIGGTFGNSLLVGSVAFQAAADAGDLLNVVTESAIIRKIKDTAVTVGQTAVTVVKTGVDYAAATAAKVWAGAQWLLNAALTANPVGLVVVAIVALVAAFVIAYKKSETFREIVGAALDAVQVVAAKVAGFFTTTIPGAFETVVNGGKRALGWVKDNWPLLLAILTGPIGLATLAIVKNFDNIKDGFTAVVTFVKSIPGKIADLGGSFKDAGSAVMDKIIDGIKGAAGFIGDIGNSVFTAVKSSLNKAIDKINSSLEFTVSIGGVNVGVNPPDIPHLARGGVTNGPTVALIGDNRGGREAVVPLDRSDALVGALRQALTALGGGLGAPLIGTVQQQPGESVDALAERLWFLLRSRA